MYWKEYVVAKFGNNQNFLKTNHGKELIVMDTLQNDINVIDDLEQYATGIQVELFDYNNKLNNEHLRRIEAEAKAVILRRKLDDMIANFEQMKSLSKRNLAHGNTPVVASSHHHHHIIHNNVLDVARSNSPYRRSMTPTKQKFSFIDTDNNDIAEGNHVVRGTSHLSIDLAHLLNSEETTTPTFDDGIEIESVVDSTVDNESVIGSAIDDDTSPRQLNNKDSSKKNLRKTLFSKFNFIKKKSSSSNSSMSPRSATIRE